MLLRLCSVAYYKFLRLLTALFSGRVSLVTRQPVSTKSFSTPVSHYSIYQLGLLFFLIYLFSFSWALFPSWHCRYFIFYLFICISLYSFCLFVLLRHYHLHALSFLGAFAKVRETTLSIPLSITNKMQRYTIFYIAVSALHVSGDSSAHHQELKLYTQHLVYVKLACCYR